MGFWNFIKGEPQTLKVTQRNTTTSYDHNGRVIETRVEEKILEMPVYPENATNIAKSLGKSPEVINTYLLPSKDKK